MIKSITIKNRLAIKSINSIDTYDIGKILLFVLIVIERNPLFASFNIIQWSALLLLGVLTIRDLIVLRNGYTKWLFLFTVISTVSILWALDYHLVVRGVFFLVKTLIVMTYALYTIKKEKSIDHLIDYVLVGTLITEIMVFPYIVHAMNRLYIIIGGSYFSANAIGPESAFAVLFAVYRIKNSRCHKWIYLSIIALSIFTILKVGSRSSLIVILVGLAIDMWNAKGLQIIRNILLAVTGAVVAVWAIKNIPQLYSTIGFRIADFFTFLQEKTVSSSTSKSDMMRFDLIIRGFYLFARRPLLGYGIDNYQSINTILYNDIHYSHNNYVELLVGTGIVGFIAYYSIYFRILFRKNVASRNTAIFGKGLLISLMVLEMFTVTYYSMNCHLVILMAYVCTQGLINKSNDMVKKRIAYY